MSFTHTNTWTLNAPNADVFRALTEPAELTRWFAQHAEVEPTSGGAYRFWGRHTLGMPTARDAAQRITRVEPNAALGFSWPLHGADTEATITLAPHEKGTTFALSHRVDGDLAMPRPRELLDDHWRLAVGNLATHLAGGTPTLPDYADPNPAVRVTITIDAPPEHVFRALVEPDRLTRWFGANSPVVEPHAGGRYSLGWSYKVDGKDVIGGPTRIIEIVPNEKLVVDWLDWRGDASVVGQTIAFTLAPNGAGGTTLALVHSGFGRTADMSDYGFGWPGFADMLKKEAEESAVTAG